MQKLPKDLREFIGLLNSHSVRYLIVGGYAVAFHGYPRVTGDIDLFVDASEENTRKLEAVLVAFGFGSVGLTAQSFQQPGIVVQLGYPPSRIDLLTEISGSDFTEAWEKRVETEFEGLPMLFIDKNTLLVNKAATGRPKDHVDLEALS